MANAALEVLQKLPNVSQILHRGKIAVITKNSRLGFGKDVVREFYDISGEAPRWIASKSTMPAFLSESIVLGRKVPTKYTTKLTTFAPDSEGTARELIYHRFYNADTGRKLVEQKFDWVIPDAKKQIEPAILDSHEGFSSWGYSDVRSRGRVDSYLPNGSVATDINYTVKKGNEYVANDFEYLLDGRPISSAKYSDIVNGHTLDYSA